VITKDIAVQNLEKYLGQDLAKLANEFGITIYKEGKQNKGWKGLTLERLAGLESSNAQAQDGFNFELKSVAFYDKKEIFTPKETMAITMINPEVLIKTPFFESHCWDKLKSLVFCAVLWEGKNDITSKLLAIRAFDFEVSKELVKEIEADYEFIRNKLTVHGFSSLTGKDGKLIQARTKGAGHGTISRAFYAKKALIKEIVKI